MGNASALPGTQASEMCLCTARHTRSVLPMMVQRKDGAKRLQICTYDLGVDLPTIRFVDRTMTMICCNEDGSEHGIGSVSRPSPSLPFMTFFSGDSKKANGTDLKSRLSRFRCSSIVVYPLQYRQS